MKSLFGEKIDSLCRERGGWPAGAIAYQAEVIGQGENPAVLMTGAVPVGVNAKGRPEFGKKRTEVRAVISIAEYRAALNVPHP